MICDPVKSIMKVSEAYDSVIFQRKPGMRHVIILGTIVKTSVDVRTGANGISIRGDAGAG